MGASDTIAITSGEWWVDMEKQQGGYFVSVGGKETGGESLAFCYPVPKGSVLANAYLMAAAPKLYKALKALIADAHYSAELNSWSIGPMSETGRLLLAKEALAEAERS